MKIVLILLLFCAPLTAYETLILSDEARYNGDLITLTGNVSVENSMGHITAETAILKKDAAHTTKLDFPWIELKRNVHLTLSDGGILLCENLYLDYTQMTGLIDGSPQISYSDKMGKVFADKAKVDYTEINGKLEVTKVTLYDNIRLLNLGTAEKEASQYALADELYYFPQTQVMLLEGINNRVLFYDTLKDVQLSARSVRAHRDPETKKESVQGIGDVRFVFGPEELEKIKTRCQFK